MKSRNPLSLLEAQRISLRLLNELDEFCSSAGIEYYLIGGALIGAVREKDLLSWDDDIDVAMKREAYERFCKEYVDGENSALLTCFRSESYRPGIAKLSDKSTVFIEPGVSPSYGVFLDVFPLDEVQSPDTLRTSCVNLAMRIYNYSHVINSEATAGHPLKSIIRIILSSTIGRWSNKHHLASVERLMKSGKGNYLINYWGAWGKKECVRKECFEGTLPVTIRGRQYPAPIGYDKWLTSIYGDYMTPPSSPVRSHGHAYWNDSQP